MHRTRISPMPQLDLATVTALWILGVVLIVPLAGLTARWGVAPVLHAVARVRRGAPRELEELRGEVRALAAAVDRLAAALEREPAPR
jgi:hypothetical protein